MSKAAISDRIKSPRDLNGLTKSELSELAAELRQKIIETTANNGGHLASNLGVVEATIAMHRVFSCPTDAFVFDVGHQAYAHKLLTGRAARFSTLRTAGGLSGFTNRGESEYDTVTAGHSGTSLSTAIGLAEANRIAGRDSWVVAVVGDGSFTNGMIYEALNQLAGKRMRLVIILNDNEMSISKNVGGVSGYLSLIRTSEGYFTFKVIANRVLGAIPLVGKHLLAGARRIRDFLKRLVNSESLFENLGLEYIGPVNGHDRERLESVLEEAKKKCVPVIVHMKTKKGYGFAPSEARPDKYHSTGAFSVEEAQNEREAEKKRGTLESEDAAKYLTEPAGTPKKRTFTHELSKLLCEAAETDPKLCAMTAAMTDGCGLSEFAKAYPDRFFDVGIAEEHLITMAGGLALGGMHPAAVLYSTFAQRVFDQMWHDISLQSAHAILFISHAGLVAGDGVTHQGIYDVSLISAVPNTVIYSPDDFAAMRISFELARSANGLAAVRYPKGGEAVYGDTPFTEAGSRLYKYVKIGDGGEYDLIVTYGRIAENALAAAKRYSAERGRSVRIVVLRQIHPTPIDCELEAMLGGAGEIFFVEEAYRAAGIADRFAADIGRRVHEISIDDGFVPHGDLPYLMKLTRMDADGIFLRMCDTEEK